MERIGATEREHQAEVMKAYPRILPRHARGNSPELQAKLNAAHERLQAMLQERREAKNREARDAGDSRGH
jgi:hypothetical protein